jgi:hypothetical protein
MNSDGDKLYTKLVAFDEICNFVIQIFSFEVILELKKLSRYYIFLFEPKMTPNEKSLNYKVVDLIESYKFCIKFNSIRVHKKL